MCYLLELLKHEILPLSLQSTHTNLGCDVYPINSNSGEDETGGCLELAGQPEQDTCECYYNNNETPLYHLSSHTFHHAAENQSAVSWHD